MDPDFIAFARAWVMRDARLSRLVQSDPEAADRLVARIAEAMARRRQTVHTDRTEGVTFSVHPTRLHPRTGVDPLALSEMAETLEGLIEEP